MQTLKLSELKLADVVQLFKGEYSTATVKKIEGDTVTFLRPYVITQDFSYSGGVICSFGYEECTYLKGTKTADELKFNVYRRKELRE